jgi:hypothetical protein
MLPYRCPRPPYRGQITSSTAKRSPFSKEKARKKRTSLPIGVGLKKHNF